MLISATVWEALVGADVMAVPIDADHVELRHESQRVAVRVLASSRSLNPSDISSLVDQHWEPVLLIVPSATPAAREIAERAGWSWLVEDGPHVVGLLQIFGHRVQVDVGAPTEAGRGRRGRRGPVPWGTLTLVRRLLDRSSATQRELATWARVSQPRVSQILASLADCRLVTRTASGWQVCDFDQLLRWWLEAYRGPDGISTLWYGLDQPREQAWAVIRQLQDKATGAPALRGDGTPAVVSGDVAADFIAPWRTPTRAVVYARTGADLTEMGLTPAGGEEATLELIVPRDPGVWPLMPTPQSESGASDGAASMPLADPLQILWDVRRSPGSDTDEAVARLWRALRDRSRALGEGHAA